ncbi:hypothetical protein LXJ15735_17880 [Lacrimispora xylanolytica]
MTALILTNILLAASCLTKKTANAANIGNNRKTVIATIHSSPYLCFIVFAKTSLVFINKAIQIVQTSDVNRIIDLYGFILSH